MGPLFPAQEMDPKIARKTFYDPSTGKLHACRFFSPVSQSASCPETLSHFSDLTVALRKHERQLNSIEEQQKKMLMTVRRETKLMEGQRQSLIKQLEMVRK